ncbi:MAG: fibronectin type III domain-containing protein [Prevotella sp.]|nr:fibronectin type III domain-containing protein [Prevotella sp.]
MNRKIVFIVLTSLLAVHLQTWGQRAYLSANEEAELREYIQTYKAKDSEFRVTPQMLSYDINTTSKKVTITLNDVFAAQEFSPDMVEKIYKRVKKILPHPYDKYDTKVLTTGVAIEELIPNRLSGNADKTRLWGNIDYRGYPWVENLSRPNDISHGLRNRHISLWASHGRYYDLKSGVWKWQRPFLFGTTEDLYTQTIVIPYLMPMLENAGAVVFSPRERDWQVNEVIVDNDRSTASGTYRETNGNNQWTQSGMAGFAWHPGTYKDNENPFTAGTTRMVTSTKKTKGLSQATYCPTFPKSGRYAVYVSYSTLSQSVPDAQYVVFHKGQSTYFRVNQRMGGGTWVYLGTFDFDKGSSGRNCVVLTNYSANGGVITTDAVRFGGGMGNIQRDGKTSGLPRALEGSRYYGQWAGAPYDVYSSKGGKDDYADDINTRSYMTNWLAGGSCYVPTLQGKNVPIELSLAVHSDAGYSPNGQALVGSLSICTTNFNNGKLNTGVSRMASFDLAEALLSGVNRDMRATYGKWARRDLYNRNYSETRCPEMPSAILETLSHQNFPDMLYGQDPNFRFNLARSIYKNLLKYIANQHGQSYVVQPLPPDNFRMEMTGKGKVKLSWNAVNDEQESTAKPTSYNIYIAIDNGGFDNGQTIKSSSCTVNLTPGRLYHFRITAVNKGGESFPTEVLSAYYQPNAEKTTMVVNGFHRLSSPAVINSASQQGFDIGADPGVTYGLTAGWSGKQQCFDRSKMGIEGKGGLGYSGNEMAGHFVAGNDFNYVVAHAEAIAAARICNIVSCSSKAVENGYVKLGKYDCVDLILGLEKDDGHSLVRYKTFSSAMQEKLRAYAKDHGNIIVSGSYIGSDMNHNVNEQYFLANVLKTRYGGTMLGNNTPTIFGLNKYFNIYRTLNAQHYAAHAPEIIHPTGNANCVMQYGDGSSACVAYKGRDYGCFVMGFPFECITEAETRNYIMRGILNYLLK